MLSIGSHICYKVKFWLNFKTNPPHIHSIRSTENFKSTVFLCGYGHHLSFAHIIYKSFFFIPNIIALRNTKSIQETPTLTLPNLQQNFIKRFRASSFFHLVRYGDLSKTNQCLIIRNFIACITRVLKWRI